MADPGFEGPREPNFRQIGVKATGKLLLGHTHAHNTRLPHNNVSSIPSKFETILYPGDSEVDGFMNRTTRFKPQYRDLPGPGAYWKPSNLVYTHDSIGKKGYGPMASESSRFKSTYTVTPGVGTYHPQYFYRPDYHRSSTTANFKLGPKRMRQIKQSDITPGPNEYAPMFPGDGKATKKRYPRQARGKGAVARLAANKAVRLGFDVSAVVRAASIADSHSSQSEVGLAARLAAGMMINDDIKTGVTSSVMQASAGTANEKKGKKKKKISESEKMLRKAAAKRTTGLRIGQGEDQPFTSTAPRFAPVKHKDTPAPGQYNPEPLTGPRQFTVEPNYTFKSGSSRTLDLRGPKSTDVPGPGHYDISQGDLSKTITDGESRIFKLGGLDRFGKPLQKRTPASITPSPAHYNPDDTALRKHSQVTRLGPSAGTGPKNQRSTSNLHATTDRLSLSSGIKPPGPAYYHPNFNALKESRSFHLNTQGRWL